MPEFHSKLMNRRKLVLALPALAVLFVVMALLFRDKPSRDTPVAAGNVPTSKPIVSGAPVGSVASETSSTSTNALFLTPNVLWQRPIREEIFARFHDWAENFRTATTDERRALETEGIELAKLRRRELRSLIQSDPERALELTIPLNVRHELPASIESLLEERVSGRGDLAVLGALAEPGKEDQVRPTIRTIQISEREFDAYVYGWRLGEPTRTKIPLNGIAVENFMAVSANSVRILEPEEVTEAKAKVGEAICSVSGQSSTIIGEEVAADIGGEVTFFCRRAHAEKANDKITAAEGGAPGPAADGETPEASTWTEGLKKVILIRVDFPDLTNAPLSDSSAISLIANLHNFYNEMSYGRAGFYTNGAGSDFTPTFRMSQPAAYYGTNDYYNQLRTEARNAATAAGYLLGNYDRDVICMGNVPGFGWAGLAYVGAAGAWLRNSFGTGVAGHELGHNWGLNHANYWDTSGASVIGPGTSVEYGDSFDTMGSASAGNNHFNARYKNYLSWLTTNEVVTATSNGVYRIYAHDNPSSPGIRGLRVVKNSQTNYWVEFRQKFTSNKWLMSGGGLRRAQNGNQKSELLDTTPGSTDLKNDSAIVIGRTFSDTLSGIHITPIGKGGTSPESLDVVVNVGTFPGNLPPTVDFSASATNVGTGAVLAFNATAFDPNGDDLAYYWDFGDGNFGTNGLTASKSWSTAGEYLVRCVVSDMKGGVGSQSLVVTIGSPTTFRISGQVQTTNGPLQGVRVYVSTRMSYTDSDGSYDIVGLPPGTYSVAASLENYTFLTNFSNPVSVGPNKTGMDFAANFTTLTAPTITTQPISQIVNPGASATFTVGASGTTPMYFQWRFNGANIASATSSSYTKPNVQATNGGNYSVVVSNLAGTATSANAVLTVNTPPSITAQPQSQTVIAGSTAMFSVAASGSAPLAYQWRQSGTNIAGATASSFSRVNAQPINAGNYTVIVTNGLGSITSALASLTINYSLTANATTGGTVAKSPNQTSYAPGSVVTLTAASVSSFPFSGWSGDASGTNNPLTVTLTTNLAITANFISPVADLIVDNPQATFSGTWSTDTSAADKYGADYRTVSSAAGTASATGTFTPNVVAGGRYDVYVSFPTINKGAASTPFLVSSSDGNLNVSVTQSSGSGGWQLLASAKLFVQGTSGFIRMANNVGQGGKNVVADAIRLVYSPNQDSSLPTITAQPTNVTVAAGSAASFHVTASGTDPLTFQWRRNGGNLSGATNGFLTLPQVQTATEGNFTVVISNFVGSVTSTVATLTVLSPPVISAQPANQVVIEGDDVSFAVGASGSQPMTYEWRFNGSPIANSTNSSLDLFDVQSVTAGSYSVSITNAAGAITSSIATLTVMSPPQILNPPQPQRVLENTPATFSVAANGAAPLAYQWRLNTLTIAGATNSTFALLSACASDAGDYDVLVSNPAGLATSEPAALIVSVRPVLDAPLILSDGIPQLTMSGTPGDVYEVEASTNAVDWTLGASVTNVNGSAQFIDQAGVSQSQRFYRARLVP